MAYITVTNSFTNGAGNVIDATQMNTNFTDLINGTSDGTKDFNIGSMVNIAGTFIFNEAGADKDFRCEGDTDQNLLFLDASTDRGAFGISAPDTKLHVHKATAGVVTAHSDTILTIENNDHVGIQLLSPNTTRSVIYFGDTDDNDVGQINYHHSYNEMNFRCGATYIATLKSSGVGIGAAFLNGGQTITAAIDVSKNAGGVDNGFVRLEELSADAAAPSADSVVIYAVDNGAGKTKLMCRFPTGAVQQIAIEP